jgi:peptidyl-prolyl cis-trans isomerase A (cyclophilin A)
MRSLRPFAAALAFATCAALCAPPAGRATTPAPETGPRIKIITSAGNIVVVLDPKHAPKTVANFLFYVGEKFFDGGTFFRAIPGFVIQGGNKAREKPSDPTVALETPSKNTDGAISMARTSDPNSATSEFFICDGQQPALDGSDTQPGYAAFGHVISGMELVRKISHAPAADEMLVSPVKIIQIVRLP